MGPCIVLHFLIDISGVCGCSPKGPKRMSGISWGIGYALFDDENGMFSGNQGECRFYETVFADGQKKINNFFLLPFLFKLVRSAMTPKEQALAGTTCLENVSDHRLHQQQASKSSSWWSEACVTRASSSMIAAQADRPGLTGGTWAGVMHWGAPP